MRKLSGLEKAFVALGAVMIIVGVIIYVNPTEATMVHSEPPSKHLPRSAWIERVSSERARVYGGLAVLMGAGVVWLGFYRGGK